MTTNSKCREVKEQIRKALGDLNQGFRHSAIFHLEYALAVMGEKP